MDLCELVDLRLGAKPRVERPPAPDGTQCRGTDPALVVSALALIVSIPSAVLSTSQLVEWLKKRRESATTAPQGSRIVRITVRGSDAMAIVNEEDARAVVELLAQGGRQGRPTAAEG